MRPPPLAFHRLRRRNLLGQLRPVRHRRDIDLDPLAGLGVALPIERQVLPELRLQDHGQQLRPGPPAGNRVERRRRLGNRFARSAGEPLPHGLDHLPLARDHLQRLGDVLAELGQPALAARAELVKVPLA